MILDLVVPQHNEETLAHMAKRLGYTSLIYTYEKPPQEVKVNFPHSIALFSTPSSPKGGKYPVIAKKVTDLEFGNVDYLTDLELETAQDKHHHRQSGFNHIYAAMAKKQKTTFCLNLKLLLTSPTPEKILGRMMQNIRLCQKYGIPIQVFSFAIDPYQMRSPKDIEAMKRALGIR